MRRWYSKEAKAEAGGGAGSKIKELINDLPGGHLSFKVSGVRVRNVVKVFHVVKLVVCAHSHRPGVVRGRACVQIVKCKGG